MVVNEWRIFIYPLLDDQLRGLKARVQAAAKADPNGYRDSPAFKLLAGINRLMLEVIPANPGAPQFRQGNTLGKDNRHWLRAKFHQRYRLFFRFSTQDKVIVCAWVNDDSTLRKAGSKTDPYALFEAMLASGDPPADMRELLAKSREI